MQPDIDYPIAWISDNSDLIYSRIDGKGIKNHIILELEKIKSSSDPWLDLNTYLMNYLFISK